MVRERLVVHVLRGIPDLVHAEVGDLDHEPAVHHAVRALQPAVALDLAVVQVDHTLKHKQREREKCFI